jgi:tRNA-Thr(GGU) m(6)t(6)A37 methyltransferase TsaA
VPLQSAAAEAVVGRIEVYLDYAAGLRDLGGFSRLHVISHLDRAPEGELVARPFLDTTLRGVFATRAPARPNRIGLSFVRLIAIDGPTLHVSGLDLLDGTPVLDLKPYVPEFDSFSDERVGWYDGKTERIHELLADDRFVELA